MHLDLRVNGKGMDQKGLRGFDLKSENGFKGFVHKTFNLNVASLDMF